VSEIETRDGRIAGERIALRPPAPGDAPRLAALASERHVARNLGRMPHPYGLAEAKAFLARVMGKAGPDDRALFIEHFQDGVIGCVGFHFEAGARLPEFGYWIGKPYWGRGYATEAARLCLADAAAKGVRAATASHFLDNPASGRVLEKAGFLPTGVVEPRPCLARGAPQPARAMVWLA
jgi:RimJ/RimL family protein N-acetyltransferase